MAFAASLSRAARPFGTGTLRKQHTSLPRARMIRARVQGLTPEQQQQLQEAMKNPEMQARMKAMQEAMARPEVQQQMAMMQAMAQNPELQRRMGELREDPELKPYFDKIQSGGMGAMMQLYNDPDFLSKLGSKLGDLKMPTPAMPPAGAAAAAAPAGAGPAAAAGGPAPEVTNLLEAARYGDVEACEDFIAIGKDVNMSDSEQRTPLHFAAGLGNPDIVEMLLEAGAKLEATDSKGNTPLHYATGYGRIAVVNQLLNEGASTSARNSTGKTPAEVAALNPNNPVMGDAALMQRLGA